MGRLFWKLFFAFWLALLVAGTGVGVVVWLHRSTLPADREALVASGGPAHSTVQTGAAVFNNGGKDALRILLEALHANTPIPLYAVDVNGEDLLGRPISANAVAAAKLLAERGDKHSSARKVVLSDAESLLLFVPIEAMRLPPRPRGPPPAFPPDGKPMPPPNHPPGPPLWLLSFVGLIASIFFSALLAWYLARPVRHLRSAFAAAAGGDLETRVQPLIGHRRDEIADLGRAYDSMADQLKELIDIQHRLFHDVSHELRSPLARLQVAIGLARQNPAEVGAAIERIEREVGRLDELVGEILVLARLESGVVGEKEDVIDLVELVEEIMVDARFEAQAGGCDIEYQGSGRALFRGRTELIARAFENVIRNAIKYTPPASTIEVQTKLDPQSGSFRIDVIDQGPGVPQQDLGSIFDPFYRCSDARGRGGYGLGLAIARRAIEAHKGSIKAANMPGKGLRVTITLPAEK